jgi:transcriptional regulator with XRE-family HTH domain
MTKLPTTTDIHVGSRIRLRRTSLGFSQGTLGEGLGITFQQVQKYEKGTNRVGAGRLQRISELLGVPVSFFFENNAGALKDMGALTMTVQSELVSNESVALAKAFLAIDDDRVRQKVIMLVQSLGSRRVIDR